MPDIDPDDVQRIAKTVSDIYSDATARLLAQVAKRMARGIEDPGWAEQKLLEIVGHRADAAKIVAELERDAGPALRKAIEDAAELGHKAAASELKLTGSLAPQTNTAAVEALARETVTKITNTHGGILRSVDDIYRSVIAEVSAPGVVTGSETRIQATQRALDRFADRGITGFRDTAGRNWEIESYAEMSTRTASSNAMVNSRMDVYQSDGRDLVIISDSPQECDKCRPWEGKILTISGSAMRGDKLDRGFKVAGSMAEARGAGLFHPNCTHDARPYIAGLTERFKDTANPEGDKLRQEQRRLERGVRQYKRREAVAITDDAKAVARAKAKAWQSRLKSHVDDNDLKRLRYREQIGKAR